MYGAKKGKILNLFIDDLSLPKPDEFGVQQVNEVCYTLASLPHILAISNLFKLFTCYKRLLYIKDSRLCYLVVKYMHCFFYKNVEAEINQHFHLCPEMHITGTLDPSYDTQLIVISMSSCLTELLALW